LAFKTNFSLKPHSLIYNHGTILAQIIIKISEKTVEVEPVNIVGIEMKKDEHIKCRLIRTLCCVFDCERYMLYGD